jgi:CarD family transcriptional regulator
MSQSSFGSKAILQGGSLFRRQTIRSTGATIANSVSPTQRLLAEALPVSQGDYVSMTMKKNALTFQIDEKVVYPAHGVGVITAVEEQEVAGFKLELLVITFDKDKLILRIPVAKAKGSGLRSLSDPAVVKQALEILSGRARAKRGVWSRRAMELQERIGTGQLTAIAEVLRDLNRGPEHEEASYSERQIFEGALDFMVREVAAVNRLTPTEAQKLIEQSLAKAPSKAETQAGAQTDSDDEAAA